MLKKTIKKGRNCESYALLSFLLLLLSFGFSVATVCSGKVKGAFFTCCAWGWRSSPKYNRWILSMWQMAGKGVGKVLPEPEVKYSLLQSSSFIAAAVENTTYEFFENYVNECIKAGFNGNIGTAESPDYYFNGKTANGERVQVMFYETENKVSISAFPA